MEGVALTSLAVEVVVVVLVTVALVTIISILKRLGLQSVRHDGVWVRLFRERQDSLKMFHILFFLRLLRYILG